MRLPKKELESFVKSYLEKREKYLQVTDMKNLPVYVLEPEILLERAGRFRRAFLEQFADGRFYFAVKSNNHPVVAGTLLQADFGLDVSSGKELSMALSLGCRDILFTGPGKTSPELTLAIENAGQVTLMLDSFHELHETERLAAGKGTSIRAGVRLCTNPAGLWRKFGIALNDLREFFQQAEDCPHIDVNGLQFHLSWNLSPQAQVDFIHLLAKSLKSYPASVLDRIRFLDIGGGYWPEPGEWLHSGYTKKEGCDIAANLAKSSPVHYRHPSSPIETFACEIGRAVRERLDFLSPRIYFEPGRWICNDAMQLMMTVTDRKAPDLVITDAGINAVGWERFETDYFPVLNLTRPSLDEKPCHVCGSLCTPHDIFGFSYFGEDIHIGDVLLIPCQGAYTYSLRQEFIKPVPEVVVMPQRQESTVTA